MSKAMGELFEAKASEWRVWPIGEEMKCLEPFRQSS